MAKRKSRTPKKTTEAPVEAPVEETVAPEPETTPEVEAAQSPEPEAIREEAPVEETESVEETTTPEPVVTPDVEELTDEDTKTSDYPAIDVLVSHLLSFNFDTMEAVHGAQAFIDTVVLELARDESKNIMKHIMQCLTSAEDDLHVKNLTAPTIHWKGDEASREAYLTLITVASAIQRQALGDLSSLSVMKNCKDRFAPLGNRIISIWFK